MILKLLYTLIPTILIELAVLILLGEKKKRVLLSSVFVNILTNIPLNLYIRCVHNGWTDIIVGEIIVVIIETLWYFYFIKRWKKAFIYSFLCNATSFLIGFLFQLVMIYFKCTT